MVNCRGIVSDIRYGDESTPSEVDIRMTVGGDLKSRKGINLPESDIKAPALTEKDIGDLAVGVKAGVDYVALSFCSTCQRFGGDSFLSHRIWISRHARHF